MVFARGGGQLGLLGLCRAPGYAGRGPPLGFREDAQKSSRVAIRGCTDNQSNEALLRKAMTTKFPSTLILMELAEELELADDHTNENFASFDPNFRIDLKGEALEWRVLTVYASAKLPSLETSKVFRLVKHRRCLLGNIAANSRYRAIGVHMAGYAELPTQSILEIG